MYLCSSIVHTCAYSSELMQSLLAMNFIAVVALKRTATSMSDVPQVVAHNTLFTYFWKARSEISVYGPADVIIRILPYQPGVYSHIFLLQNLSRFYAAFVVSFRHIL